MGKKGKKLSRKCEVVGDRYVGYGRFSFMYRDLRFEKYF